MPRHPRPRGPSKSAPATGSTSSERNRVVRDPRCLRPGVSDSTRGQASDSESGDSDSRNISEKEKLASGEKCTLHFIQCKVYLATVRRPERVGELSNPWSGFSPKLTRRTSLRPTFFPGSTDGENLDSAFQIGPLRDRPISGGGSRLPRATPYQFSYLSRIQCGKIPAEVQSGISADPEEALWIILPGFVRMKWNC